MCSPWRRVRLGKIAPGIWKPQPMTQLEAAHPQGSRESAPGCDDPFEEHFARESRKNAAVLVMQWTGIDPRQASVGESLVALVRAAGREAELACAASLPHAGESLAAALAGRTQPLVLISSATEPWQRTHLDPLLESIEKCDHTIGRRPAPGAGAGIRWLASWPRRILFAVPILDLHSPCQLHRREPLLEIVMQSRSRFLNLEILAKATFLGHLIDEVPVPALAGATSRTGQFSDLSRVLKHPVFRRPLAPAEHLEREREGHNRPGGEDADRGGDLHEPSPLEHHLPERGDKLGER